VLPDALPLQTGLHEMKRIDSSPYRKEPWTIYPFTPRLGACW